MLTRHLALAAVVAACSRSAPAPVPADARPIADLAAVAGRVPSEVAAVLGAPIRDPGDYRDVVWYANGITVRYRDGRADWLQATGLARHAFGPDVLRLFGVSSPPAPSRREGNVLWWDGGRVPPFAVVTLHTHARLHGGTDYANFYVTRSDRVF